MLAGWSDGDVIAWSRALGGVVEQSGGEIVTTGPSCRDEMAARVLLTSAFPGLEKELERSPAGDRPAEVLYGLAAARAEEVIAWHAKWPQVQGEFK